MKSQNAPYTSALLSESHSGERDLPILLRMRNRRYVDEGNWQSMPSEWVEAGGEV